MTAMTGLPVGLERPELTMEQEEWLGRVDKIAPLLEENRKRAERDRFTPVEVFEALRDGGFHRLWVSTQFGGEQASIRTGATVIQALARIDASIAWQIGVQGAIGRLSDYLAEPVARELFQQHQGFIVGGVNPAGRAERVDGGYLVDGVWGFASGSAHADWLVCAAFVTENGERVMTEHGPEQAMVFVPRSAATMLDTWHTLGLRGTGSNDYRVTETFVPQEYAVPRAMILRAPAARPSRAFPIGYYDFGPFTSASTALGVAQDALDSFKELALAKTPAAGSSKLAGSHTTQEKLARAEMAVYSAKLMLSDAADKAMALGETGGDSLSALVRLTAATVAEQAVSAVDVLYQQAGSSSLYENSRLERCFRDVHSATKHITLSSSHFETVGQYLLGGPLLMRR